MTSHSERVATLRSPPSNRGAAVLWFGVLAPPFAWFVGLVVDYALVHLACARGTMLPLHLGTLAVLLLAASGGWVGWREWRRAGVEWPDEAGTARTRTRFMSALAAMGSALFSLVIVAQWTTKLFLSPCMGI